MKIPTILTVQPSVAFIATALMLAELAFKGIDIKPIIAGIIDEVIPALA